ncbi:MAG: AtpZ/AtpI family protein [Chthonomonadaceae bacterium]|nr:AtpZ/AtpI family protein [Chthonomonadaceae bacterium]
MSDEEDRLVKIQEELDKAAAFELEEPDQHDAKALESIRQRGREGLEKLKKHTPEGSKGGFVGAEGGRNLGLGLQIAYAILGVPIVFFGVGWLIDRQVGGTLWQGLLTIFGAAIAVWYAVIASGKSK